MDVKKAYMSNVCSNFHFKSLFKEPICFKNPENPTVIDLILTEFSLSFLNSCVVETRQSNFHKIVLPVFKVTCKKLVSIKINYKDYKKLNIEAFRVELLKTYKYKYL